MAHLGRGDGLSIRLFGTTGTGLRGEAFVGRAEAAIDLVRSACDHFVDGYRREPEAADSHLGPEWGPYADHTRLDLLLHATRELTHHGAEIALLRDLHRAHFATG